MINFFPLPDARQGSGYVTLKGNAGGGESIKGDLWPYIEIEEDPLDDEDDVDDIEAISKKSGEQVPSDHLGQLNYKPHAFVKGSTRGLTGIMASIEPVDILENMSAAVGQASPSYNVTGPDGTTRTRPGRRTGSKKGYFSPPTPHDPEQEFYAYSLKDIALDDEEMPVKHSDRTRERIHKKNVSQSVRNESLRRYVREVLLTFNSDV